MKDPALMFYTANFLAETRRMNYEQVGKYIKLICFQHQTGHIIEEEFFEVVSKSDTTISCLYDVDNEGRYFVQHIDDAIEKRRQFCITRSQNAKKKPPKEVVLPNSI